MNGMLFLWRRIDSAGAEFNADRCLLRMKRSRLFIFLAYLGTLFENLTKKSQSFQDWKTSVVSGFSFWAVEPIRKDENDRKLLIWLNPKLFYCSPFFETIDYVFCLKEFLDRSDIAFRRFHWIDLAVLKCVLRNLPPVMFRGKASNFTNSRLRRRLQKYVPRHL